MDKWLSSILIWWAAVDLKSVVEFSQLGSILQTFPLTHLLFSEHCWGYYWSTITRTAILSCTQDWAIDDNANPCSVYLTFEVSRHTWWVHLSVSQCHWIHHFPSIMLTVTVQASNWLAVSACFMCTHCSSGCQLAPNPISTSSLLVSVLYRFDRKHASLPNTSVRVMHVKLFYGAFIGRTECAPAVPYRSFTYDAALISVALSRLVKYFLPQVANLLVPLSLVAHLVSHDRQVHY